jgi:predicted MPP superfamily phosphohydrolase
MDSEPDLIVLPGDLYQPAADRTEEGLPAVRALLRELQAPHGVYFVQGDQEDLGFAARVLEGTGITLLDDEVVQIPVRDRTVLLGGNSLDYGSPGADAVRARLQSEPDDGAITVLLSHRPDTVLGLPDDSGVDLTIAGHTHGGQVVVPGIGPLITLTDVPRAVARGGLHTVHGNQIYVSPGVGVERGDSPQLRLFNRPAVALLELGG